MSCDRETSPCKVPFATTGSWFTSLTGHELQCIQNLCVRSDNVQFLQWAHGFAHSGLGPTVTPDGANIAGRNEARQATMVLHGETAQPGRRRGESQVSG